MYDPPGILESIHQRWWTLGKLSCERSSIFDLLRLNLSHVMHAIFDIIFYVCLPHLLWEGFVRINLDRMAWFVELD